MKRTEAKQSLRERGKVEQQLSANKKEFEVRKQQSNS
jgi:hypothetical protein